MSNHKLVLDPIYRDTIDSMGEMIHVVDPDLRIILANRTFKGFAKDLGILDNVLGHYVFNIFPRPPKRARNEYKTVLITGRTLVTEDTHIINGKEMIVETKKIPISIEGRVSSVLTVTTDVTESKRAEKALAASEVRYRTLVSVALDPILILDEEGYFSLLNGAAADQFGSHPEDLVGRSIFDIMPEDSARTFMRQARFAQAEEGVPTMEIPINLEGGLRYYSTNVQEIIDPSTQKRSFLMVAHEITQIKLAEEALKEAHEVLERRVDERTRELVEVNRMLREEVQEHRRTESALRKSEGLYSTLARNFPSGGLLVFDDDFKITLAYGEALAKAGFSEDPAMSRTVFEAHHPKALAALEPSYRRALYGQSSRIELAWNGRLYMVEVVPVKDNDSKVIAGMVVVQDITEKKKQEEELLRYQKIDAVGKLAGGIAHDFNNILTAIIGNISITKMMLDNDDVAMENLTLAEKAAIRAKGLTAQLLTFSKGGQPVKRVASVSWLLKETTKISLSGSNCSFTFDIQPNLWCVEMDVAQIEQVMSNLLVNAREAMPEGGEIHIKAENVVLNNYSYPALKEGKYVRIRVSDDGMGIPPEILLKIFEPYFTTKRTGSGLGLSIVYSIIEKHQGHIEVQSTVGRGTTFTILLPATMARVREEPPAIERIIRGNGKILLMDDEAMVLEVATEMLRLLGYEVCAVGSGEEAIAQFAKHAQTGGRFDAVIMDLTIPGGMGGKETIKHLRRIDPEVKVIVSSGYSTDPIMADPKVFGFCGVVPKPYTLGELSRSVHAVLQNQITSD